MPTTGKSPEEWVGQDVMVEIFTGAVDVQIATRLDGINDWGVILTPVEPGVSLAHGLAA